MVRFSSPQIKLFENGSISCSVVCKSLWPPWTIGHQVLLSMEFSRQEYWEWVAMPACRWIFPIQGLKPLSPASQADSLPSYSRVASKYRLWYTWKLYAWELIFCLRSRPHVLLWGWGSSHTVASPPAENYEKQHKATSACGFVIFWLGPQISAGPTDVCLSWCILRLCCFAPSLSQALHESLWKRVVSPEDFKSPCQGLPWWLSGTESTYQCRRQGFDSWSRKIPRAMAQLLSLCSRAWELHPLSPHTLTLCSTSREAAARRSCLTAMKRSQLLPAPREKPAQHWRPSTADKI